MESSIEGKFIRGPKKTPVWAFALYAFLAFLILGFIFYQLFSIFVNAQEQNHAFSNYYKSLKCTSLCPVENILNEDQKQQRLFDASCQSTCERIYLESLSEHERTLLNAGDFQEDPSYVNFINYTRGYAHCTSQMNSNASFDQTKCFQDLFWSMSKDVDLSEVRIPSYTSYAFSIVDFSCNPPSVKVSHIRGAAKNISLVFILEDTRGQRGGFTSSSVPNIGESQIYPINVKGVGTLSKIELFAQDTSDNRKVTNKIWKRCPS